MWALVSHREGNKDGAGKERLRMVEERDGEKEKILEHVFPDDRDGKLGAGVIF